jgi:iron(III) transport system substrate-binding protein
MMMKNKIKYIFGAAGILCASIAAADMDYLAGVEGSLITQCSLDTASCEAIIKEFNKAVTQKTGKSFKASTIRLSTSESITRLNAELGSSKKAAKRKCAKFSGTELDACLNKIYKTRVDILFGGTDGPYRAAIQDNIFAKHDYPLTNVHPWASDLTKSSDGRLGALYMGILGIGYNPSVLADKKLPAPAGWADLAKPAYKSSVGVANANTSGTSYKYLSSMLLAFGSEDEGWKRIKANHQNISQYTKSGSAPCKMVARGEMPVCIGFLAVIADLKNAGLAIEGVVPVEGTLFEVGPIGIVIGSKNRKNAEAFAQFLYEPSTQQVMEASGSRQFHVNVASATPAGAPDVSTVKLLEVPKKYGTKGFKNSVITTWNNDVYPIAR